MENTGMQKVPLGGLEFHVMQRNAGGDGGTTIEVYGDVEGKPVQVLRFDMFREDPHFHYSPGIRANDVQLHLDKKAAPQALDWALTQIREHIPEMLRIAGFKPLAEHVDRKAFATGWTKVRDAALASRV